MLPNATDKEVGRAGRQHDAWVGARIAQSDGTSAQTPGGVRAESARLARRPGRWCDARRRVKRAEACGAPWARLRLSPSGGLFACVLASAVMSGCGVPPASVIDDSSDDGDGFQFEAELDDPALTSLEIEPDQLIVRTLPGAEAADLTLAYAAVDATVIESIPEIDATVLQVPAGTLFAASAALSADPSIEGIQKNYLYEEGATPNDPLLSQQGQIAQIGADDAWTVTSGSADVIIAILDSGVATDHPDLKGSLLPGINVVDGNADVSDVVGHGTAVAGAAAASGNNRTGVAGVAWGASILPIRVTRADGRASSSVIAKAIIAAVYNGAMVINVSFGPLQTDKTVLAAAQRARHNGALVFISSGNDGQTKTSAADDSALFIGAVDEASAVARFSTRGPFIDFVAPGVRVLTTERGGDYAPANGTSFASPIAAGVAALLWSVEPGFRPTTVVEIMQQTAADLGKAGRDGDYGYGLVDAAAAVDLARRTNVPVDSAPPALSVSSPADGATVSGKVTISAAATDRYGVADVVLSVDGEPIASDAVSPYTFSLNATGLSAGVHTLTLVATDTSGNASAPVERQINVGRGASDKTAPEVVIIAPTEGATVIGTVELRVLATDNAGLARIVFTVDGKTQSSAAVDGPRAEHSFFWNTSTLSSGRHTVQVTATDAAGLSSSASVVVRK